MANKVNKISINAFEEAVKNTYEPFTIVEWNGLQVIIKRHLSLAEVVKFVDVCTKACFDQENASFVPEAKDLAIRSCIVGFYSNITLPANIEKQYELIYHSMIIDLISANVDQLQLSSITRAIEEKVSHIAAANVELINKQLSDLYGALEGMQQQMSEMFDGIDSEDIKGVFSALSNGAFDESKIVKAYMDSKK